jgi:apolipoprotein D and lipocalin family protein
MTLATKLLLVLGTVAAAAALTACLTRTTRPTIAPVAQIDLARFMGDWYVIAHIPARVERDAYAAVESYRLAEDGRVRTTFRYRDGGFDEPVETMEPVATVRAGSGNAVWDMQFVWPVKAEYVIVHVDADYTQTIVGRSKRDYVWLMARTPTISETDYAAHVARIGALGYDTGRLRRVPQQ